MPEQEFRRRVKEAAGRVQARTGVDPLAVPLAMAVTTDLRLEKLPGAIGWGLASMSGAVGFTATGVLRGGAPSDGPVAWTLVVLAILMALGAVACVVVARAARSRMPARLRYEDAWARLAVELWPVIRDGRVAASGASGSYSRIEFVIAVRDGSPLDRFERRAPFTRNP